MREGSGLIQACTAFMASISSPSASPSQVSATVSIDLGDRSYDIRIGQGLLSDPTQFEGLPKSSTALIVTNTTVGPLYTAKLKQALGAHH